MLMSVCVTLWGLKKILISFKPVHTNLIELKSLQAIQTAHKYSFTDRKRILMFLTDH